MIRAEQVDKELNRAHTNPQKHHPNPTPRRRLLRTKTHPRTSR